MDVVWQYRLFYGPSDVTEDGWTSWKTLRAETVHYGPRTLLSLDPHATGRIEFRIKPEPVSDTSLDEDYYLGIDDEDDLDDQEDVWPDFIDEGGYYFGQQGH
jgi:hypothetical protein